MNKFDPVKLTSYESDFALWAAGELIPETCPYTIEQFLDPEFLPGEL